MIYRKVIVKWNIHTSGDFKAWSYSRIATELMVLFGLGDDDYRVYADHIEATPRAFTIKWINPIRLSVYDIVLKKHKTKNAIQIRIRLFKLFVFPLIFPVMGLLTGFEWISLFSGILAYVICAMFFLLATMIKLSIIKKRIKEYVSQ